MSKMSEQIKKISQARELAIKNGAKAFSQALQQSAPQPIRICGQCTHFNGNFQMPRCTRVQVHNLVDGRNMDADCHPERNKGTQCGPDGKLFNLKRSAA
jgi:hypothetical protein